MTQCNRNIQMRMILSFIIINYKSEKYLQKCLSSIKEKILGVSYEIIVVNNDTKNVETHRNASLQGGNIKIINTGKNIGFGAGCNVGAKSAQGEILCFLNPDTEILSDNIGDILNKFQNDEKLGVIGPRLLTDKGKTQWWCAGKDFSLGQLFKNNFGRIESKKIWESEKEVMSDWVSGAALFMKRDVFEKIKGFDERFFMYAEDMDLCRRTRNAGHKVLYCPQFVILHKGGKSRDNLIKQKIQFFKSSFYYIIKWLGN